MSHALAQLFSKHLLRVLPAQASQLASPSLPGAAAGLTAATLAHDAPRRLALVVTSSAIELERVYGDLCALGKESGVIPYAYPQQLESDAEVSGLRLRVIHLLRETQNVAKAEQPCVIVTSIQALLQPAPDPSALAAASRLFKVGASLAFDQTIEHLVLMGYLRVADVEAPGQLAVRGGILDIWPPATPAPWRAEFFGNEIESLRIFDPASQTSLEKRDEVWIPPCSERALATVQLPCLLPAQIDVLWLEHDRLQAALVQTEVARDLHTLLHGKAETSCVLPLIVEGCAPHRQLFTGEPPPPLMPLLPLDIAAVPGLAELGASDAHHPELLAQARKRLLDELTVRTQAGEVVMICADTAGTCELLVRELGSTTAIEIHRLALSGGFILPGLAVVSQSDLYTVRKQTTRRPSINTAVALRGGRVENAADLEPGDYVVHVDHGIGRYMGSTEIEVNGQRSEVFTVEYAEGARLHVPVSHAHLLSRYVGVAGHKVKLHALGGKRWTKEKVDAERAVVDLASSLLETQARRNVVEGIAFNCEPTWLHEFEAAFPYQETPDQEKVMADIKKDMAAQRPMDRLICGDAGYGKTELAMRAAFIAVMNGKQVAVLVPTTVLAEQHFETFSDRMAAYPVRIEVISRFHSYTQCQKILAAAAAGEIDILIGTHGLLANSVRFKELGLLIIDEEQRFGVSHKEKLKQVRQVVDVLTLSATPIPRTLYMSMTGARDLSLLQTPPRERLAVETKIARDSDSVISAAIQQELRRNGQVYFLYNRVMSIHLMERRLSKLLPSVRIGVAHGQMPAQELAQIMRDFEAGEIDVLLCTTLVESGLDIPRANTILIHRADRFGIADLYQLRGRVGRSSQKGYAWLLLPEGGHIDEDARQRIAALQKHSGLGAGFNLALRDLEIRGAGNLLGAAQSGHIAAIGFGLYCQLLKRTIARMKGEAPPLLVDVDLALDFIDISPGSIDDARAACLPYAYIEDEAHRLMVHRRIAEANSLFDVQALRRELADRYGQLPVAVQRLLKMTELRIFAAEKQVGRIETRDGKIYLYRHQTRTPLHQHNRIPVLMGKTAEAKMNALVRVLAQVP